MERKNPESFGEDILTEAIRNAVREKIEKIMVEELQAFLGAGPYERAENRKGYRHGFETRGFSNSKNRRSQPLWVRLSSDSPEGESSNRRAPLWSGKARLSPVISDG